MQLSATKPSSRVTCHLQVIYFSYSTSDSVSERRGCEILVQLPFVAWWSRGSPHRDSVGMFLRDLIFDDLSTCCSDCSEVSLIVRYLFLLFQFSKGKVLWQMRRAGRGKTGMEWQRRALIRDVFTSFPTNLKHETLLMKGRVTRKKNTHQKLYNMIELLDSYFCVCSFVKYKACGVSLKSFKMQFIIVHLMTEF